MQRVKVDPPETLPIPAIIQSQNFEDLGSEYRLKTIPEENSDQYATANNINLEYSLIAV